MKIHLKIAFLVTPLLLLGAGCAGLPGFFPNGKSIGAKAVVSCDYLGQTYGKGASRADEDGCNICTCGETGWSCTRMKCTDISATAGGTIKGTLVGPKPGDVPAQQICAESYLANSRRCISTPTGATTFELRMPLGRWWVSSTLTEDPNGKVAWWSEAVKCGRGPTCLDHSLTAVTLAKDGDVVTADPQDWGMKGAVNSFDIIPSKRMDVLFYYPESVFEARTTDIQSVEVLTKPYPSEDTDPYKSLGQATQTGEEKGLQVWQLPVPPGLEAKDVTVKVVDTDGAFQIWRSLGWTRAEATLHPEDSASSTTSN
jgi:hypothetical protein